MRQLTRRLKPALIGDRAFYRTVLAITMPMLIQNSVANFIILLNNIMVGQLGTAQMSGVAVAGQLLVIVNLCIFGGLSGPSIYGAQFYGAGNLKGLLHTFRLRLWVVGLVFVAALAVLSIWGADLIGLFLQGEGTQAEARDVMDYALRYMRIIIWGVLPSGLTQSYAGVLRETGETTLPMKAGIAAVLTNLLGNWLLIFGNLGCPALGVTGAAVSTLISQCLELGIIAFGAHTTPRHAFLRGAYRTLRVPLKLARTVTTRGLPLLVNELIWSLGATMMMQLYSMRGLQVLAGLNIAGTVSNMFNTSFIALGNTVAVIIGQILGAGEVDKARRSAWQLTALTAAVCVVMGGIMALLAGFFPTLYNTEDAVRTMASRFILTSALLMPLHASAHISFHTLRAGGSTTVTFIFDSGYSWLIMIPFTMALVHLTDLPILVLYPLSQATAIIKSLMGILFVARSKWAKNIVQVDA